MEPLMCGMQPLLLCHVGKVLRNIQCLTHMPVRPAKYCRMVFYLPTRALYCAASEIVAALAAAPSSGNELMAGARDQQKSYQCTALIAFPKIFWGLLGDPPLPGPAMHPTCLWLQTAQEQFIFREMLAKNRLKMNGHVHGPLLVVPTVIH